MYMSGSIFVCPGVSSVPTPPCFCPLSLDCMPLDKALLAKKQRIYPSKNPNGLSKKKHFSLVVRKNYTRLVRATNI